MGSVKQQRFKKVGMYIFWQIYRKQKMNQSLPNHTHGKWATCQSGKTFDSCNPRN